MFGRRKKAKPEDVSVKLVNGELCFEITLALSHIEGDHKAFDEKDLDKIARRKFNIERFEKWQPDKKEMYQLIEIEGEWPYWKLQFFPFKARDPDQACETLDRILIHLRRD